MKYREFGNGSKSEPTKVQYFGLMKAIDNLRERTKGEHKWNGIGSQLSTYEIPVVKNFDGKLKD